MKKILNFLIILLIIIIIFFLGYSFFYKNMNITHNTILSASEKEELITYINDIYNQNLSIPEFDNINNANESWLWDNINQYLSNHDEFSKRNEKYCDYSYNEITNFANILYGDNLKKSFPTGNQIMIYDIETDKYGPPAYCMEHFSKYTIDSIVKNSKNYTVNIIDYTISLYECLGNNPTNHIKFYNSNEYNINSDNTKEIFYVTDLKNNYTNKILKNKDKFTSKTLTIEYNEKNKNYNITSCKYNNSTKDILLLSYSKLLNSFQIYNLQYDENEFIDSNIAELKNFNELTSVYTNNGIEIFKKTHSLLLFKNDKVYIESGDFDITSLIYSTEFSDIKTNENEISCTVTTHLKENPEDAESSNYYSYNFKIIKDNNEWKIDDFCLNFSN